VTLSPKARAGIVSWVACGLFLLANMLYQEKLSQRAWVYLALAVMLPAMLIGQWIYHREVLKLEAPDLPRAELNLAPEHIPNAVWLAILPPLIAAALLWWVTAYGSTLPWRDTWLGPPKPAASHQMFRMAGVMFVIWNCLGSWRAVYGLAQWSGMPRAYISRRKRLILAIALQWLLLICTAAWSCNMLFRMPAMLAIVVGVTAGAGFSAMTWIYWQEVRFRSEEPPIGTWCYFDFRDPAFLGPGGLNLASAWSWALAAVALSPIVLAEWLLHQAQV
jgi:hypothetical protein